MLRLCTIAPAASAPGCLTSYALPPQWGFPVYLWSATVLTANPSTSGHRFGTSAHSKIGHSSDLKHKNISAADTTRKAVCAQGLGFVRGTGGAGCGDTIKPVGGAAAPSTPPGAAKSGPPGAGGAGVTLEAGSAIGVVGLLANSLPPNPTAKTSVAAPPNSAIAAFV